ncbi:hypothetical protein TcCL_NonESM07719, partial [Trypanosoma cruzi]
MEKTKRKKKKKKLVRVCSSVVWTYSACIQKLGLVIFFFLYVYVCQSQEWGQIKNNSETGEGGDLVFPGVFVYLSPIHIPFPLILYGILCTVCSFKWNIIISAPSALS